MRRLHVVVGLLLVLLTPIGAFASPLDSFTDGFTDLVSPETDRQGQQVSYEKDYIDSYEPVDVTLDSPSMRALPEDATATDYVNNTLDAYNKVPMGFGGNWSWFQALFWFLGGNGESSPFGVSLMVAAVGLVFMWWGVRKAVRMIMAAWRSGKQTV